MPRLSLDPESHLYLPEEHLGNGISLKEAMDFELWEWEFKDEETVRTILAPGLATTEAIEELTVTAYSPMIKRSIGMRHSPELIAMQPRWTRDEHRHALALGSIARRLEIPSLLDTGEVGRELPAKRMAQFGAIGMLTRASKQASDRITSVIAFGGNINEIQGGSDYRHKEERLRAAGEVALADLYGTFANHEAIHQATYAKIFKRYYSTLSERGKAQVRWLGPQHFNLVGEREVGRDRLGELLVEGGYDIDDLAALLDSFGNRLLRLETPISFAYRALMVCAKAYRDDKKRGALPIQQD